MSVAGEKPVVRHTRTPAPRSTAIASSAPSMGRTARREARPVRGLEPFVRASRRHVVAQHLAEHLELRAAHVVRRCASRPVTRPCRARRPPTPSVSTNASSTTPSSRTVVPARSSTARSTALIPASAAFDDHDGHALTLAHPTPPRQRRAGSRPPDGRGYRPARAGPRHQRRRCRGPGPQGPARALVDAGHDVVVVAPDGEHSGAGAAIGRLHRSGPSGASPSTGQTCPASRSTRSPRRPP